MVGTDNPNINESGKVC